MYGLLINVNQKKENIEVECALCAKAYVAAKESKCYMLPVIDSARGIRLTGLEFLEFLPVLVFR